jgi:putative oxidoreductase
MFLTSPDVHLTLLRLTVAIIMFAHGAQKMFGWFGGHGVSWTLEMWEKWFGFPSYITAFIIVMEFLSSMFLFTGFLTRPAAVIVISIMIGAVFYVHLPWGFFMNWYNDAQRGEGFEYHILMIAAATVLALKGAGKFSVDHFLSQLHGQKQPDFRHVHER